MSKMKKMAVLLFASVLLFSFVFAPAGPRTVEPARAPTLSPETTEEVLQWYEDMEQPGFSPKMSHYFADWKETGVLSDKVYTKSDGTPRALVFAAPWVDHNAISASVEIDWWVDLMVMKAFAVSIPSADAVVALSEVAGIGSIDADLRKLPVKDDFVKEIDFPDSPPERGVEMDVIKEVVGANDPVATTYDGTGIVVGDIDTGFDFGNPELQDAYHTGSYDPTGEGITPMVMANATPVANATEWLEDGNVLTYVMGGNVYANVTGWDPDVNDQGTHRNLLARFFDVYAGAWAIDTGDWRDTLWQDYMLPQTGNLSAGSHYRLGYVFQQQGGPYAKIFAPAIMWNNTGTMDWKLSIDWDGTNFWNWFWTGGFYYESVNLTDATTNATLLSVLDWDFTDDIFTDGEIYDLSNPIVAYDYTGDMIDDFSLGALSWVYDGIEWFDDDPLWQGFRPDGNGFCLLFDDGSHGTATAAHVAAQGLYDWYNADNETYFKMEGIAPGADIIGVRGLSGLSDFGSYLWVCGFTLNETSLEFYYESGSGHEADIVTNSWGWVVEPDGALKYLGWTWDILSTPAYIEGDYPGVLHVFSAGNEGGGFQTIGPPGASPGVMTVGASTSSHWLDYLYGPDQPYEGMASFSSKGPQTSGYAKPDVLAPGLAGYSAVPWYSPFYADVWSGGPYGDPDPANYTLFSGTSQAAPVAAGVAALVMDALNGNGGNPMVVKNILQSTATDLGYDPATQGFGRVDANDACDFAENGGLVGANPNSFSTYGDIIETTFWGADWGYGSDAIQGWMGIPLEATVNKSLVDYPEPLWEGSIFFGELYPGETAEVNYNLYALAGDMYGTPVTAGSPTATAYYMREAATYTAIDTTFSYNDTIVVDEQMYGFHNLSELIGTDFDTAIGLYSYMTVGVSFNNTDVAGDFPWMFLYDWEDVNGDGIPNQWNGTHGNELSRLTSASDNGITNMMPYAVGTGELDTMLAGDYTVVIHDPMFDAAGVTWWNTTGNAFRVTVIFWELAVDSNIAIVDGGASYSANLTVTAPSEYGIHQGFVVMEGAVKVPYSYMVKANASLAAGEIHTIVDGFGAELNPYDAPVYGIMDEDPDDWDFRSYKLHVDHATAAYLGVRVDWDMPGYDMYVVVEGGNGTHVVRTEASANNENVTAMIASILGAGEYYIYLHPIAIADWAQLPVSYTMEVMWYEALTNQAPTMTWYADDSATPAVLTPGTGYTLEGDHITVNASFPDFDLANMPEYEATTTTISFLSGLYAVFDGVHADPGGNDAWPIPLALTDNYVWHTVEGISAADNVLVTLESPADPSFDVYTWVDANDDDDVQLDELVGTALLSVDDGGGGATETGSFTAAADMDIAIRVFSWAWAWHPGDEYTLYVDTRVSVDAASVGQDSEYDTYDFLRNGTFTVTVTATTDTNLHYTTNYGSIRFENFFSPVLGPVDVSGAGLEKTITWSATDLNAGDEHFFEVLLSSDGGNSFQLLRKNLTTTSFVWDSEGFLNQTYIVAVRVYDNDPALNPDALADEDYTLGLTDERLSAEFLAGDITITPTTTTTEPTTTPVPPPTPIDPLIIGLIAGIGAGVVVVLILFLVKRR